MPQSLCMSEWRLWRSCGAATEESLKLSLDDTPFQTRMINNDSNFRYSKAKAVDAVDDRRGIQLCDSNIQVSVDHTCKPRRP